MGEVLTNGVYLPDRGERNAYDGLKGNWNTLDSIAGKVPGYDAHISDTDIHVTAADKQTWNGKADASHVHNADDVTTGVFDAARIPNLDASKITTGTIDIDRLPQGALERLVKVADQAARYALTASDVQLGDTVQQLDTGVMYVVTDVTKLDSADGYTEYTAGSATSVPWSGVTGKPADYTPASHSHGNITNDGKVGTAANKPLITGTGGVVQAGSFGTSANTFCEGNDSRLSDARTPVAHTHVTADVTDLLNTTHEWTKEQVCDEGFTAKSTTIERCVTPETIKHINFTFKDKNDKGIGAVRRYFRNNGIQELQVFGNTRIKDSQYDETGSDVFFGFSESIKPDGTKTFTFDGYMGSNLEPLSANQSIGSVSNQWNNLYAKNYYYNGVAWGLDKANVWSAENTFTSNNINIQRPFILGDNTYQVARLQVLDSASTPQRLGTFNFVHHNNNLSRLEIGIYGLNSNNEINNKFLLFQLEPDNTSSFFPLNNSQINLGTSTNKWKTLNGVNPGALSLPNLNYSDSNQWIDISGNITKFTGGDNWYYPAVDGWVFVITKDNPVSLNVLVLGAVNSNKLIAGASGVLEASSGAMWVSSPAPAGSRVRIRANNGTVEAAWFITCQGNV